MVQEVSGEFKDISFIVVIERLLAISLMVSLDKTFLDLIWSLKLPEVSVGDKSL